MPANRVSASVSAAERQDVMNAIVTISQSLSCLIDLGTEERRGMSSWAIAIERLPAKRLFEALQPMLLALTRLKEMIDDTAVAAGSEAYAAVLEVYRYAKANGTVAGLDNLVDEMGQRFTQQSGRGRSASARSTNSTSNAGSGS